MRLSSIYQCSCDNCKAEKINLAAKNDDGKFKPVLKAAENAFKYLHEKGSYKPEDLKEKPYKDLIDETYKVFDPVIRDNEVPAEMLSKLQNDAFIFSGLKTHAQLLEASSLLLDENGNIKSFSKFSQEFNKINVDYNQNYLEAEHQFAINSSQMAANWAALDSNGRYNLQYRTANDDRVREAHRVLQDVTLPVDDPFWLSYYPPNGWRCRCTAVEVLKSKYELSDSKKAIQWGDKATTQIGKDGKNRLEMFRFNPGAQEKVFPPKHPYNNVKGATSVKEELNKQNEYKLPNELKSLFDTKNIKIDNEFLKLVDKDLKFQFSDKYSRAFGTSYYSTKQHKIVLDIPSNLDTDSIKRVFYHEFGHSIDQKRGYYKNSKTTDLINKYLKDEKFGFSYFKELDDKVKSIPSIDRKTIEQKMAIRDTIMAMTLNYGAGHTKKYFMMKGEYNRQREFLAHCFENRFVGNEIFENLAPELYKDMKKLIDELNTDK